MFLFPNHIKRNLPQTSVSDRDREIEKECLTRVIASPPSSLSTSEQEQNEIALLICVFCFSLD